ncbi:MAG: hypothetical protein AAFU41_18710 [Pseudomonadota bacterium]
MRESQINSTHSMTGNIQGFELPRGCLFSSVLILVLIVATIAGLVQIF